ncbi:50S ribosomal protein L37ae [Candidatus Micrarchaeota archaeon]|nr:50S ribosomal protein L37ae [Candidatus Micrarchaeota archaeon]
MVKFSVRCGAEIRKRVNAVSKSKRSKYFCPACGKKKVKRKGFAVWTCRSCGTTFSGGAYAATTPIGEAGSKIIEDLKKS